MKPHSREMTGDRSAGSMPGGRTPTRLIPSRWRDPRLALGLLFIGGGGLLGAALSHGDDGFVEVQRWASSPLVGTPVDASMVETVRVSFADESSAASFVGPQSDLTGRYLRVPVTRGELVVAEHTSPARPQRQTELPLRVGAVGMPLPLVIGDHVRVWVRQERFTRELFEDVVVLALGRPPAGGEGERTVVVGLGPGQSARLGRALEELAGAEVILTRERYDVPGSEPR